MTDSTQQETGRTLWVWNDLDKGANADIRQASPSEIIEARDLLVNAERVEWCEEHRALEAVEEDPGFCWRYDGDKPCRIVSKLLVDYPTEEE